MTIPVLKHHTGRASLGGVRRVSTGDHGQAGLQQSLAYLLLLNTSYVMNQIIFNILVRTNTKMGMENCLVEHLVLQTKTVK